MKYLQSFLAGSAIDRLAEPLTKPTEPGRLPRDEGYVSFVSAHRGPIAGSEAPSHKGAIPWRDEVASWTEGRRQEWEERAAILEYDGELDRPTAERKAFETFSRRSLVESPQIDTEIT